MIVLSPEKSENQEVVHEISRFLRKTSSKTKELRKKEKEIIDKFGLNRNDIENIFDLIEGE